MELKWTSKALSDLARLYDFLAPVNKPAAARTVQALAAAPASLLVMPTLPGSEEDQKTRSIIGQQVRHITGMHAHQLLDGFGGAIAPSDP